MAKPAKKKVRRGKTQAVKELLSSKPSLRGTPLARIADCLLGELNTELARRIRALLRSGNGAEIAQIAMPDPSAYVDAKQFAKDYLARSLLRKSVALDTGIDTEDAAYQKWLAVEDTCATANSQGGRIPENVEPCLHGLCEQVLDLARIKIHSCLGAFSWDAAVTEARFSGGATTRLSRRNSEPANKYIGPNGPRTTRACALLSICAIWHSPLWRSVSEAQHGPDPFKWVEVCDYAQLSTAPKDATVDRIIVMENELNMYFQLGIGSMMRNRLRRVGINLNDQTVNQELALRASETGMQATVDLASASDSVNSVLVMDLLPADWFKAIETTRSRQVYSKKLKRFVSLEKISAMGNGFTFELESLIFWALSEACVDLEQQNSGKLEQIVSVYGDDIILPVQACDLLYAVLAYCGFQVNVTKSYVTGPFRESCGKHYFQGHDVTPFYVKDQGSELQDLYWFCNSVRLWCGSTGIPLPRTYHQCLVEVKKLRKTPHKVPLSMGLRAGLICNFDEASPPLAKPRLWPSRTDLCNTKGLHWYGGYVVKALTPRRQKRKRSPIGSWLRDMDSREDMVGSRDDLTSRLSYLWGASDSFEVVDTGSVFWETSYHEVSWWDSVPSVVHLAC